MKGTGTWNLGEAVEFGTVLTTLLSMSYESVKFSL